MKSILFVMHDMPIGGTEKALLNLLLSDGFRDHYDVTLLLLHREGAFLPYVPEWVKIAELEGIDGFERDLSRSPKTVLLGYAKKLRFLSAARYLARHLHFRRTQDRTAIWRELLDRNHVSHPGHYDIAVSYLGPDDFLSYLTLERIDADEKVQWIHFDVERYAFHDYFASRYYPRFDRIHAVSEEAKRSLVARVPSVAEKTDVYPNEISPALCRQMADSGEGFTDGYDGIRILTVGRLSSEKGQQCIPDIAKALCGASPDFRWYLIGEGETRNEIEAKIARYDLGDRVILLGALANPYPYMKQASLYVQPSLHEGFGLTVAEVKLFGTRIIASDIPAFRSQLCGYAEGELIEMKERNLENAVRHAIGAIRTSGAGNTVAR